jgi:hypothetical protein
MKKNTKGVPIAESTDEIDTRHVVRMTYNLAARTLDNNSKCCKSKILLCL